MYHFDQVGSIAGSSSMVCISFDYSLLIAACGQDAVCRVASGLADVDASLRELFAKVLCKMQNAPAVQHATAIALLANELRWMLMRAADAAGDAQHNTAEIHNIAQKQESLCLQSGSYGDAEQCRDADANIAEAQERRSLH